MTRKTHYTVVGAGPGGKAIAAHLAVTGHPVTLFDPVDARLAEIRDRGGIQLLSAGNHGPAGFGPLRAAIITSSFRLLC